MFMLRVLLVALACARAGGRLHPETDAELGPGAGRRDPAELTADYWVQEAQSAIKRRAARSGGGGGGGGGAARNVILFMGDGMSMPTVAAARALLGQRDGRPGEEAELSFEAFPTVGFSKTYCVNAQVADSACSANAYLTGVKNNQGMLGLTAGVARRDCAAARDARHHVDSIAAWALADGRDVGIVTTTRITHASPAGTFARAANRGWETDQLVAADGHDPELCPDIAHQLVHSYPGNKFKVILGGGRRNFLSNETLDQEGTRGRRTDGRDLIQEWQDDKRSRNATFAYAWNRDQLMSVYDDPPEYLMGLFEGNHMQYHLEANEITEPTLKEMTEIAIRSLSRNEKGYFLFVEGGRIDHAHHANLVHLALDETIEFHAAVAGALQRVAAEDTLVVVTADHAHVMAYSGYAARGRDVLAASPARDAHAVPYMTLSYINGPGARAQLDGVRVDVTADSNFGKTRWASHADVPLASETHGGDDVGVYAWGPHHHMFAGVYEQSQLPHLMAYAGCFGRGLTACGDRANAAAAVVNTAGFTLIAVLIVAVNRRLY